MSDENIYVLCDVDSRSASDAFAAHPMAKQYDDFRIMLHEEADSIDAVTVSTPDHTHAAAASMAMNLGKHVYCQKPLARTIYEVRQLSSLATRTGVATQMGNQGHAGDGTRLIREWVEAGAIGTVREVHYWTNRPIWPQAIERSLEMHHIPEHFAWDLWLGPAQFRPYHPAYAPFRWRGWWDFGTGALGDIACHAMDAAFWVLQLGYPTRITAESTRLFPETAPATSRIVYDFPSRGNRPEITVVWRDGGLTPSLPPELVGDATWSFTGIGGQLWIGDEGKLVAGVYGEDPRLLNATRDAEVRADVAQSYPRSEGVHAEWIAACKGGEPAGSNFPGHAGPLSEMVLLGNLAVRAGHPVEINPTTGDVLTEGIPDEMVRPRYREGWEL
jgi:predicted dehydrogenase